MKTLGISATLIQVRLYKLQEYKICLTKDRRYVWKKVKQKGQPTYLVQLPGNSGEFHAIKQDEPYMTLEEWDARPIQKSPLGLPVVLVSLNKQKNLPHTLYRTKEGNYVMRFACHNKELLPSEIQQLSAHERVLLEREYEKQRLAARKRKTDLQRARRAKLREQKKKKESSKQS